MNHTHPCANYNCPNVVPCDGEQTPNPDGWPTAWCASYNDLTADDVYCPTCMDAREAAHQRDMAEQEAAS